MQNLPPDIQLLQQRLQQRVGKCDRLFSKATVYTFKITESHWLNIEYLERELETNTKINISINTTAFGYIRDGVVRWENVQNESFMDCIESLMDSFYWSLIQQAEQVQKNLNLIRS